MDSGRLAGIARHDRPEGPVERLHHVSVTAAEGVHGDFRGGLAAMKPGRKRQVSLIERACWEAAAADAHCMLDWWHARRNLLVEGLRIPRAAGVKVRVGASVIIEITEECSPCDRMDELHPGLRAALRPDWRGGFLGRVVEDGHISVGDEIRIV